MANKEVELVFVDAFLRRVGWRVIDVTPRENPDFIVRVGEGVVGIEVTQIFKNDFSGRGSKNKHAEARRVRVLQTLADEYYREDERPISVRAYFAEPLDHALVADLVSRVREGVPDVEWATNEIEVRGSSGVTKFYIRRLPASCTGYRAWTSINNSLGWVRPLGAEAISERIQAKAMRLSSYMRVVERVCLLLVVDRTRESGMFSWSPSGVPVRSLGFEAVYLYVHPVDVFRVA